MIAKRLQKKLDRFLYFRKASREERRAIIVDFKAKATDKNVARALYKDMRKDARKRYRKDFYKIIPYALCLVSMIPSLELIIFMSLSLLGYDNTTFEIAYSGFINKLEASVLGTVYNALPRLDMYVMPVFPFVFIPVGMLLRKIRLRNYGRNIAMHLLQILMLVIALTLLLLFYASFMYGGEPW